MPLWHAFLDKRAHDFKRFYYNVRVGGPDMTNIIADEAMKKMWYNATAKRIDVLAEKTDYLWIIEVASSPYLRAVGQCLSYKFLWEEDPKIKKPAIMVLLCYRLDSDLKRILKHFNVRVIEIEKPSWTDYVL